MRAFLNVALTGLLALGMLGTVGCGRAAEVAIGVLPAFLIGEAQEIQLGAEAAQQVLQQTPAYPDANLQAYVQRVGQGVAARSDRPQLPYQFTLIQASEPNAFALPGGFIFVTPSLMRLMENEAQLAGVLAHEVAHAANRHGVQLIRQAALAQGVEVAVLGDAAPQVQVAVANVLRTLVLKGYGRQKEYEADRFGEIYATRLGYDPAQLPRFLNLLEQATGSGPSWLTILEDHPATADRVAALQQQILAEGLQGMQTNAAAFLQATAALR